LNNFKGDSKLYSWIYRIATNEAITFINKKAKISGATSGELKSRIVENLEADTHFDGNEIQIKLQKAILTLPEKQQLVFKMRYFEEIKYEEMSTILGTSVGALKASYHLAVKKIENFMNKD
jgi:RNA polymerase sigma-70 factor (ECF subfamily)